MGPDLGHTDRSAPNSTTPLSCEEIRAFDRWAIDGLGIPGIVLMENAARSVAKTVLDVARTQVACRVAMLCGTGNNGGDGYAAARHLVNAGVAVTVVQTGAPAAPAIDAVINERICRNMGIRSIDAGVAQGLEEAIAAVAAATIVVDGLLGSGSRGAPRGCMAALIEAANRSNAVRIAIDIPTGLQADSGEVLEPCFRADTTVTLLAPKLGFDKPAARAVLGNVIVAGIGISRNAMQAAPSSLQ